jgi:hypothetical protein
MIRDSDHLARLIDLDLEFGEPQQGVTMKADGPIVLAPDSDSPASSAGPEPDHRLSRWLVSFASGSDWSDVGEFVATDAASAIERAVEVFGAASAYRAEKIPWDAAPLAKPGR